MVSWQLLVEASRTLFAIYGTSIAAIIAVLVFFWKSEKRRQYRGILVLSLIFVVFSLMILAVGYTLLGVGNYSIYEIYIIVSVSAYCVSLILFLLGITRSFMHDVSLRESHFTRMFLPSAICERLFPNSYIRQMQERRPFSFLGLDLKSEDIKTVSKGYSILAISDELSEGTVKDLLMTFLLDGLQKGETLDYVCTDAHPFLIKERITRIAQSQNIDLSSYASDDIVLIDAYSPSYGFNEDILLLKDKEIKLEVCIIKAASISGVHSSCMDAWYIHKKRLKKSKGKELRRPHRMVYDHLSVLGNRYGHDQLKEFFLHLLSAEKAYGMITIIIEYRTTESEVLSLLRQLVDLVFEIKRKGEGLDVNALEVYKARGLSLQPGTVVPL